MQNKFLKISVICTLVFIVLNELVGFTSAAVLPWLHNATDIDTQNLYHIQLNIQQVLAALTHLFFFLSALAMIVCNKRSALAWIGGGLLSLNGLFVFVRIIVRYILRLMENTETEALLYSNGISWAQLVAFCTALILIGVHYKSVGMIVTASLLTIMDIIKQVAWLVFITDVSAYMTYYSIISGILGIAVFVVELIYLILWIRQTKQKPI